MDLRAKAKKVQELAAVRLIEENPRNEVVEDAAAAKTRAHELGAPIYRPEGIVAVEYGHPSEDGYYYIYPKDSAAFKEVHESFSWIVEKVKYFEELPAENTDASEALADIKQEFDPKGYIASIAENSDEYKENNSSKKTAESHWASLNTVYRRVSDWNGRAAEDFQLLWVDPSDQIIVGQLAALEISHQVLCAANAAYSEGQASVKTALEQTEKALDELAVSAEVSWSTTLTVISGVLTIVGGGAAVVAAPATLGASGIAGWAGIAAGVSSIGASIATSMKGSGSVPNESAEIGGADVESVMESVAGVFEELKDQIADVERRLCDWLQELQGEINAVDETVKLSTGYRVLTVRERYFEPPRPGMVKSMDSHLDNAEDGLSQSEAESAAEDIFDADAMGISTDEVSAAIDELENMGTELLPEIADSYSGVATSTSSITDQGKSSFSEAAGEELPDDVYAHAGAGRSLLLEWQSFNDTVAEFFENTAENLQLLGEIVALGAKSMRTVDEDSARSIWQITDDFPGLKD